MTDIIFGRVVTRKGIVRDNEEYGRWEAEQSGYYHSDDVEMRIAQEQENLVAMGWRQGYVDGLGTIYIDSWHKHRKQVA